MQFAIVWPVPSCLSYIQRLYVVLEARDPQYGARDPVPKGCVSWQWPADSSKGMAIYLLLSETTRLKGRGADGGWWMEDGGWKMMEPCHLLGCDVFHRAGSEHPAQHSRIKIDVQFALWAGNNK